MKNFKHRDFIDQYRYRVAQVAIGANTLRSQGEGGLIAIVRKYLVEEVSLKKLEEIRSKKSFEDFLNRHTEALRKKIGRKAKIGSGKKKGWGAARKSLNIFLRDACDSRILCEFYKIKFAKEWLEIPLDSHVATKIRAEMKEMNREFNVVWRGIIHLDENVSQKYQDAASEILAKYRHFGTESRVDLDVYFWRSENE